MCSDVWHTDKQPLRGWNERWVNAMFAYVDKLYAQKNMYIAANCEAEAKFCAMSPVAFRDKEARQSPQRHDGGHCLKPMVEGGPHLQGVAEPGTWRTRHRRKLMALRRCHARALILFFILAPPSSRELLSLAPNHLQHIRAWAKHELRAAAHVPREDANRWD